MFQFRGWRLWHAVGGRLVRLAASRVHLGAVEVFFERGTGVRVMLHLGRSGRAGIAAVAATTVVLLGLSVPVAVADTSPPPTSPVTPVTVSADGLPTWQTNGVVWSQVTVGNIVYATGQFSTARPPNGVPGTTRKLANLYAYDLTTGNPVDTFNHVTNGVGRIITASPDGRFVYVGGDFTTVDGKARAHVAQFAINPATGAATLTSFAPPLNSRVWAIAPTNFTVYMGGWFKTASGKLRTNLAAFTNGGTLLPWAPVANSSVQSMVVAPKGDRVIVGGQFTTLNGKPAYGMGSLNATTGATLPWAANATIRAAGPKGGIDTLRTDGTNIYGGAWADGAGATFEGNFAAAPDTGKIVFLNDCNGDTYDLLPVDGLLYQVGHSHSCKAVGGFANSTPLLDHFATVFTTAVNGVNTGPDDRGWNYAGKPKSTLLDWFPTLTPGNFTGLHQAAWSITGNTQYIALGGEFTAVNGVYQQGLTRFAVSNKAPNKVGATSSSVIPPTAAPTTSGTAVVTWPAAWDKDNTRLTYDLIRVDSGGTATKINTQTQDSTFWNLPTMSFADSGLTPGATYRYQTKVTDPFGNVVYSVLSGSMKVPSGPGTVNSTFTAAGPCRVFDTRSGAGTCAGAAKVAKAPLAPNSALTVKVTGVAGVPANATAVVLNITAVAASLPTFITAWPAGSARPTASNLNVNNANPTPNLAVVPIGTNGSVSFYNLRGRVNLIADISGYFAPTTGSTFTPTGPCRVLDTRSTGGNCTNPPTVPKAAVGAGKTLTVKVTGVNGVPSTATAVVLNLTAVGATKGTYVTAWPAGKTRPTVSNLNVASTTPTPNLAVVPIGANGSISLYNFAGSVNLIADISGYFAPTVSSFFASTGPCRLFDTRYGTGNCAGGATQPVPRAPLTDAGTVRVKVTGVGGVPNDATAVIVNLTAVGATKGTFVTAWPGDPATLPTVSNLNVSGAAPTSNLAVIPVGSDGYIEFYNLKGSVNLIGDLAGYFEP
jgi:hypothetical protein